MSEKKSRKKEFEKYHGGKEPQEIDPHVLGRILAAQNVIFALPNATRIAEFYSQTLLSIPGITACRVCLANQSIPVGNMEDIPCAVCEASRRSSDPGAILPAEPDFKCSLTTQSDTRVVAIDSYQHHFGFFVFKLDSAADFDIYQPFINNLSNYVAITFENRLQEELLQTAHHDLERRVEERTHDLTTANEALQREIVERQRTEKALRESEEQVRQLFDESPVAMILSRGEDERVDWVNDKFIELFGYTIEDMPDAAHWWPLAYPDGNYREEIKAGWNKRVEKAMREESQITPMEATVRCKDGSLRHIEFRLSSIGEKHLVTFVDLTEHKQAEEKLLASEQLFRALVENAPDFIARYDREFRRIYVNPAIQKLFKTPAENVLGKTPSDQSPVYAPQVYIDHLRHVIETSTETAIEMPFRTADGQMHWGHMRFVPEFGTDGKVESVLAIGRDIHEIKENERRFRMLAENFPDLVMRFDREGRHIYVNSAFEKVLGLTVGSVIGKTLQELPHRIKSKESSAFIARIYRVFDEGIANESVAHWDTEMGERIFENRYVPEKDAAGNVATVLCIARDITERKRMEDTLHERERHSQSLLRLSRKLEQAEAYSDVLNAAQDEVRNVIGYKNLWAYLLTEDKKYAHAIFASGPIQDSVMSEDGTATLVIDGDPMLEAIASAQEIVVIEDAQVDERVNREIVTKLGNRTIVNVPIVLFDRHMGSVGTGTFSDEGVRVPTISEQEYLTALSSHMAVTLDRIHLLDQRRQAEQTLRENEEKFRMLIEQSAEGVILADENGTIVEWNHACEKMMGVAQSQALGQPLWDVMVKLIAPERATEERLEEIKSGILDALHNGRSSLFNAPIEMEFYPLPGREKRYFHQTIFPIKTEKGYRIASLVEDFTERRQMAETLSAREQEFRTLAENSPDNIARYDINCRTIYANRTLEKTLGRPASEMLGTFPSEAGFIVEAKEYQDKIVEVLKTGEKAELDLVLPDIGEGVRHHNIRFVAERGAEGAITGVLAIGRDITERKRMEEALSASESELRTLISTMTDVIFVGNSEGRYLKVLDTNLPLLYKPPNELLGKTLHEVFPKDQADFFLNHIRQALNTRKSVDFEYSLPIGDKKMWFYATVSPMTDDHILMVARDITDRKQAEEELRESERRLIAAQHMAHVGYWERDFDTNRVALSDEACRIFGISEQGLSLDLDQWHLRWVALIHPEDQSRLIKLLGEVLAGIRSYDVEYRIIRPDGTVRYIYSQAEVRRDASGHPHNMLGMMQDITERKQAEQALRESEWRYHEIFDNVLDGLYLIQVTETRRFRVMEVNPAVERITGISCSRFLGKTPEEILPAEIAGIINDKFIHCLETGQPTEEEAELDLPAGRRNIHSTLIPAQDETGKIRRIIGISRDVTERKRAEDVLANERALLRAVIDLSPDAIFVKDMECRKVLANPADLERMGVRSESDALGRSDFDVYPQDMAARVFANDQRVLQTGQPLLNREESYLMRDGQLHWLLTSKVPLRNSTGQVIGLVGVSRDITEQKQAEEDLRASENRFRVLSENAFVGIYIIQDGRLSYVNSAMAKIFGYAPEELTGASPALVIHPDDQAMVAENIQRRIVGEIETIHYEFRGRCKDGEIKNIEVLGGRTDLGGQAAIIGNLMDITDRKRVEEEIARSLAAEKKARKVAEILREANESLSRTFDIDDVLHNLLRYLMHLVSYDSANVMLQEGDFHLRVVAMSGYEHWTDLDAAQRLVFDIRTIPSLNEVVTTQQSLMIANTYEYPGWLRVPGTGHVVSWLGVPIIANGQVIGVYSVDKAEPDFFTDEHRLLAEGLAAQAAVAIQNSRLHDQITHANMELEQRVASRTAQLEEANRELEAFAYSVSHDLRAPLRHIDGFIDMLQKRTGASLDDKSRYYMDVIADSAGKMGVLIDDLLLFSRMGRSEMFKSQVDLNELVQDVLRECRPETEGRTIQWNIATMPFINGDRAMLRVVLMNLISNALKFTRSREVAKIEIGCEIKEARELIFFVRDNGVGFDMKYVGKLFGVFQRLHRQEDFEGTGIGLANVHRIINRHGGRTWAEGKLNEGATFYFSLPYTNVTG